MATLRALECLVALVDHGSVTRAATSLGLTQPALSHQISSLERELGTPVVHKLGRGVRMTAAGQAVAEEARVALRAADQAVRTGRRIGEGTSGRLRVACAETMTVWLLVPVLRRWRLSRRDVVIELSEHTSADNMVELVATGAADLAVGPMPSPTEEHVEVLGAEEVVVVAPAGHPFTTKPVVTFTDLAAEPFVHYVPDNGLSAWIDLLAAQHRVVLDPVLRTRSPRTAAQLAAAGMGVTIVPASALSTRPPGVVRSLSPVVTQQVAVVVGAPSDTLVAAFVADLRQRTFPSVR
jgi:DNA-binding transcriptional LysR family regulator